MAAVNAVIVCIKAKINTGSVFLKRFDDSALFPSLYSVFYQRRLSLLISPPPRRISRRGGETVRLASGAQDLIICKLDRLAKKKKKKNLSRKLADISQCDWGEMRLRK